MKIEVIKGIGIGILLAVVAFLGYKFFTQINLIVRMNNEQQLILQWICKTDPTTCGQTPKTPSVQIPNISK